MHELKIIVFLMNFFIIIGALNLLVLILEQIFSHWTRFVWNKTRFLNWLNCVGLPEAKKEKLENYDDLYKAACTACEYIKDDVTRHECYQRIKKYIVEEFDA